MAVAGRVRIEEQKQTALINIQKNKEAALRVIFRVNLTTWNLGGRAIILGPNFFGFLIQKFSSS